MPACRFKSSPDRCGRPPLPLDPNRISPGRVFASAISSASDFAGTRRIDHQHEGERGDQRQRREVALHVEAGTAGIDRRIDREVPGGAEEDRMTVRLGLRDALSGDQAVRARTVLDDHRLAEPLRHLRRHQPCQDVDPAAGRKADHDPDRPRGERRLRHRAAREQRSRGRAEHKRAPCRRSRPRHSSRAYRRPPAPL